jgi:hypothetical protein
MGAVLTHYELELVDHYPMFLASQVESLRHIARYLPETPMGFNCYPQVSPTHQCSSSSHSLTSPCPAGASWDNPPN